LSPPVLFCPLFHCSRPPRDLHSFPTRRSSDLIPAPQHPVASDTSPSQGDVRPGSHGTPNGGTDGCTVSPDGEQFGAGFEANYTPESSQVRDPFSTSDVQYVQFYPQLQNNDSEGDIGDHGYIKEVNPGKLFTVHPEAE